MAEEKQDDIFNKLKQNIWVVVSIILALALLGVLVFPGKITGNVISENDAGVLMTEFLNSKVGSGVSLISVAVEDSLYKIIVSYQGQAIPVYMTKDGQYFIQGAEKIGVTGEIIAQQTTSVSVPKSNKPIVELFIMTHCPYGTQAEKGIIPALKLLGNAIDGKIRFVHYFMHGDIEEQETYRQVCIREEQSVKYLSYLECFLEAGDIEGCLTKAGIDKIKLNSCISTNAEKYYAEDSKLSKGYGVQGSPTLIINGVESDAGRDSQSYLIGICNAFNSAVSVCSQTLSSSSPSPGFGYSDSGTAGSTASCS